MRNFKIFKRLARFVFSCWKKFFARSIELPIGNESIVRLMVELDSFKDVEQFSNAIRFRENFEANILKLRPGSYIKVNGVNFRLNSHKGLVSLREACSDDFGLNSRMRFSIKIIKKFF